MPRRRGRVQHEGFRIPTPRPQAGSGQASVQAPPAQQPQWPAQQTQPQQPAPAQQTQPQWPAQQTQPQQPAQAQQTQTQPQLPAQQAQPRRRRQRKKRLGVVWHKWTDLRLLDHQPAYRAHCDCDFVMHLHLVEDDLLVGRARSTQLPRCSPQRRVFWKQCVVDLASQLANRSQELVVAHTADPGAFIDTLLTGLLSDPNLVNSFSSVTIFTHSEVCTEELQTEASVRQALDTVTSNCGVLCELQTYWGGLTLHHIEDLERRGMSGANFPLFKGQYNSGSKKCGIRSPVEMPKKLRPGLLGASGKQVLAAVNIIFNEFYFEHADGSFWEPTADMSDSCGGNSTSDGLDDVLTPAQSAPYFRERTFEHQWTGGETAALAYLEEFFKDGQKLHGYRGATESFAHGESENPVMSGTRLSPWLAFGCITARQVVQLAKNCESKFGRKGGGKGLGKGGSTGTRLQTELNFRDFLRFAIHFHWGKRLFQLSGPFDLSENAIAWKADRERFDKWRFGQTGFPFVDAGMRELRKTGYMSHLHRQCCAAFLVRDLQMDWRWGAEHFESCLVDYTPDANWGNWAYRILQRPCLASSRAVWLDDAGGKASSKVLEPNVPHLSTMECVAWPLVHDCKFEHTTFWCPELKKLPNHDLMREPWRVLGDTNDPGQQVCVKPFKDSPLWFCAANRTNWSYEYFWLPGGAYIPQHWQTHDDSFNANQSCTGPQNESIFQLGQDYPFPMVRPINLEVHLDKLPVQNFVWGDSDPAMRTHITQSDQKQNTTRRKQKRNTKKNKQ